MSATECCLPAFDPFADLDASLGSCMDKAIDDLFAFCGAAPFDTTSALPLTSLAVGPDAFDKSIGASPTFSAADCKRKRPMSLSDQYLMDQAAKRRRASEQHPAYATERHNSAPMPSQTDLGPQYEVRYAADRRQTYIPYMSTPQSSPQIGQPLYASSYDQNGALQVPDIGSWGQASSSALSMSPRRLNTESPSLGGELTPQSSYSGTSYPTAYTPIFSPVNAFAKQPPRPSYGPSHYESGPLPPPVHASSTAPIPHIPATDNTEYLPSVINRVTQEQQQRQQRQDSMPDRYSISNASRQTSRELDHDTHSRRTSLGTSPSHSLNGPDGAQKLQCWEHGCNGRVFSTFSNLLRHQREKAGLASKSSCPRCGAEFTRTTARNSHLKHAKCKPRSEQSSYQSD